MNDYFEKYKSFKKEVDEACLVIDKNSSSKLKEEIETLKDNFNGSGLSEIWCDKVSVVFNEIINKCSSSLGEVITSIENEFTKAEELYKTLQEKLTELEKANNDYQEAYKTATMFVEVSEAKPKTKEEIKAEIENIKTLEANALKLIEEIEDIKQKLMNINDGIVEDNNTQIEEEIVLPTVEENVQNVSKSVVQESSPAPTNGSAIAIDSDTSVIQLSNMCMAEQGSPEGAKFELSLLINQFKSVNGREPASATELSNFMQNFGYGGGHWYAARTRNMASLPSANQVYINAITDVLNGNRVLPSNVVEHDCFSDIAKIVVNGQTLSDYSSIRNHANYIRDNTVIYNKMGSVYTFYEFAPNGGDPFGYF